ncbi:hypothetical protein LTR72_011099 [Exophiala xenobiotica]|nr:hypothetical protein LTR92_011476 [Exophiala xenobiotica]KAK5215889.1 hypothetical protein LTR72_011099 [Exophiala xenobiotica]KAK5284747.1 hypothetical protein LTR14_011521 [Exophiala xenobiotica]KAK5311685.1 hypothetical protein LTR93_011635 [Exophiala xenobiotica]KAK5468998.1 hypothetical protein LTR55_011472 [Exophiala xenobiotica]
MRRIDVLESDESRLVGVLRQVALCQSLPPEERKEIADVLHMVSVEQGAIRDDDLQTPTWSQSSSSVRQDPVRSARGHESGLASRPRPGEDRAASSVVRTGRKGELSQIVDLDRGAGVSGYAGEMSEMSWIQRVTELLRGQTSAGQSQLPSEDSHHLASPMDYTYFMDDINLMDVDEDDVDSTAWPPFEVAILLSEAFFHAMQGAFPFILREEFLQRLVNFPTARALPSWSDRRWLAMANLVWAVGSRWLRMTELATPDFASTTCSTMLAPGHWA